MHQEPCPNGSVHSFNRRWTSTAEDAFLSLPHPFENLAPGDASPFDPIRTGSPNTQESNWCSSLQTEAQQLDYESLFGLEPESGGKSIFSLGGNIDDGSLVPDAESTVDFNFDPNDGFDHSSQSSLSYSDLPCANSPSRGTPKGAPTTSDASNMSERLSTSLSSPFTSNTSLSNTLSSGPRADFASPDRLLSADDPQPKCLALPPARTLRCTICSRTFASGTRLV